MPTYRVIATATQDGLRWRYASSWHRTLPEALAAMRARQDECFDTVELRPMAGRLP